MKTKITVLNSLLMTLISCFILGFMMYISQFVTATSGERQLKYIVHDNAEEVEWEKGKLDLDDLDLFENHISTLVYSDDGVLLGGFASDHALFTIYPLINREVTSVNLDGVQYLLYDFLVEDSKNGNIFLRGIVSVSEISETITLLFNITFISLPIFILLSALGSYYITKKSIKPLEKIIETAEDITKGEDLSQRINLNQGKDEIHKLAQTFDTMFSKLEQAFISEKQFSSDVSHELRTPTSVILAECESQLEENFSLEEKQESFQSIYRQGKKMQQLISTLLNLVRLDNGVQKINYEKVDLSELITIILEEQESLLLQNKKLFSEIEKNVFCDCDYTLMIRVISNLIDNGMKYGKDDGFVKVSLTENQDTVQITVEDDGIGIGAEDLDHIFKRFYRVDAARSENQSDSMGVGLSMVEQIIKLHHGNITVDSAVGKGTSFHLVLPKDREI